VRKREKGGPTQKERLLRESNLFSIGPPEAYKEKDLKYVEEEKARGEGKKKHETTSFSRVKRFKKRKRNRCKRKKE